MSRSLSVRPAAELMAAVSGLLVVAPWAHLTAIALGDNALPGLIWRLGLVAVAAYYASREIYRRLGGGHRRRSLPAAIHGAAGVSLAAALLAVPAAGLGLSWPLWLAAGMVAWILGTMLATWSPDAGAMHAHMVYGAVGLTACILVASHLGVLDQASGGIFPLTGLWLIAVVVATALSRFAELSDRYISVPVTRFWPPVLGAIGIICLLLALFFGLAAPLALEVLKVPAAFLLWLVRSALLIVGYGLGIVAQVAVWILSRLLRPGEWDGGQPPDMGGPPEFPDTGTGSPLVLPPDLLHWMAAGAVVAAGIGLTVYLLLRLRPGATEQAPDESRESFASLAAIARWARRRWVRAAIRGRAVLPGAVPRTATGFYSALLALAERRGARRPAPTTPLRHQPAVHACFPAATDEADAILDAFSHEYYGGRPLDPGELEPLSRAWAVIRGQGRRRPTES